MSKPLTMERLAALRSLFADVKHGTVAIAQHENGVDCDVLGEAFRDAMAYAKQSRREAFEAHILNAVGLLSQVVERIARAQRGGK